MAKTYNNIYLDARQRLRSAGVEEAQLEARELICLATGKDRPAFFRDLQLYAVSSVEEKINRLLERRLKGEPLAYILGSWSFYGLDLDVNPSVLIPRPDTEVIAERAIQIAKGSGDHARVLDLCTGTGCIGLAVARDAKNCRVVLADISEEALSIARKNASKNGLSGSVTTFRANALTEPPQLIWDFNLIVCNPPYIPTGELDGLDVSVRDYEPHMALDGGADGLDFYRSVAKNWRQAMRSTCILLFEVGDGQADAVETILTQNGYRNIRRHKDAFGNWRGVEGSVN